MPPGNSKFSVVFFLPRVEGSAVLEGAVVVIADVIAGHRPPGADFRHMFHHHDQIIIRVEHINHQHFKHQCSLRRDLSTCLEEKKK